MASRQMAACRFLIPTRFVSEGSLCIIEQRASLTDVSGWGETAERHDVDCVSRDRFRIDVFPLPGGEVSLHSAWKCPHSVYPPRFPPAATYNRRIVHRLIRRFRIVPGLLEARSVQQPGHW